jgi:hypothetical protein
LTVHEGVSVPAAQLNEERLQQQRWGKIAGYQWVNFALLFVVGLLLYNQVSLKQAYRANTEALRHFQPLVVRENELGQTQLLTRQGLNFSPDETSRSQRSAVLGYLSPGTDESHGPGLLRPLVSVDVGRVRRRDPAEPISRRNGSRNSSKKQTSSSTK